MKKIISLFVILVLSVTFLSVGVSASKALKVEVSDDYKTVYCNGDTYTYTEEDLLEDPTERGSVILTDKQEREINGIEAYVSEEYIRLDIYFKQGGSVYWLYKNDKFEARSDLSYLKSSKCTFFVDYESQYTVRVKKLKGKKMTMTAQEVLMYDWSQVCDGDTGRPRGRLLIDYQTEDFYFLDFADIEDYDAQNFDFMDYESFTVYKVTDAKLLQQLQDDYTGAKDIVDLDFDVGKAFSLIIFSIAFALIPLGILIFSVIMLCIKKNTKKTRYIVTTALSGAELTAFLIIFVNIIIHW